MCCRDSDPELSADIQSMMTVIDFRVTAETVYSRLLSVAVRIENPDLERQRNVLVQSIRSKRKQLRDLEDLLLLHLSNHEGDILEDENLIKVELNCPEFSHLAFSFWQTFFFPDFANCNSIS